MRDLALIARELARRAPLLRRKPSSTRALAQALLTEVTSCPVGDQIMGAGALVRVRVCWCACVDAGVDVLVRV